MSNKINLIFIKKLLLITQGALGITSITTKKKNHTSISYNYINKKAQTQKML